MSGEGKKRNIFLTGMMGVGKSTVGALLARKLAYVFIDTDAVIERKFGLSVADIFAAEGEPFFRKQEHLLLREILTRQNQIVATGGGMLADSHNLELASDSGLVVLLHAPMGVLTHRLRDTDRPLLQGGDLTAVLSEIYSRRAEAYERIALKIDTGADQVGLVADQIADIYQNWLCE